MRICYKTETQPLEERQGQGAMSARDLPHPSAISAEAKAFFEAAPPPTHWPITDETIAAVRQRERDGCAPHSEAARAALTERVEDIEIAGVPVQLVEPKGYDRNNDTTALLYFHGGAHVTGSPFEDLPITAGLAHRLGLKVYSSGYRLAPEHPFPAGLEDGLAVYRALIDDYGPNGLAVAGESAGGNLALAVLLGARDAGLALPAAAALLSPWCDISDTGDSNRTLSGLDPTLDYAPHLKEAAAAYAGGRDLTDPLVSPLYGDYRPGFPPSLITSGTRDLLLSDCARLSTALRRAGVDARLHVWEGMWHVFEWYPDLPEAQQSLDEIADFLNGHLGRD
jgi:acetyl esterase/lipase